MCGLAVLSNTNYIPAESELGEIQLLLEEQIIALQDADAEVVGAQAVLDEKIRLQTVIATKLDRFRAMLMAPARKLPPEILAEMFRWCIPALGLVLDTRTSPWLLGQVCHLWRNITTSTAGLWNHCNFEPHDVILLAQRTPLMEIALARSKAFPLSIRLHLSDWDEEGHPRFPIILIKTILDVILPYSSNIYNLTLRMRPVLLPLVLNNLDAPLPILKFLDITFGPEQPGTVIDELTLSPSIKQLRKLSVSIPQPLSNTIYNRPLYAPSITSLVLHTTISHRACLLLLSVCQQLKDAYITCVDSRRPLLEGGAIINNSLNTLELKILGKPEPLLDCLDLPHIEELTIAFQPVSLTEDSWTTARLVTVVSRLPKSLRFLRLKQLKIRGEHLLKVIDHLPLLERMEVPDNDGEGTPTVLDVLAQRSAVKDRELDLDSPMRKN